MKYNPKIPYQKYQTDRHQSAYSYFFFGTDLTVKLDKEILPKTKYEVQEHEGFNWVVLNQKPKQSQTLEITRDLPITRNYDYQEELSLDVLNDDQNYQTYLIHDLDTKVNNKVTPGGPLLDKYLKKDGSTDIDQSYLPHYGDQMITKGQIDSMYSHIPEGPVGPIGPVGPKGHQGEQGEEGSKGPNGLHGPKGDPGSKGAKGTHGHQGNSGDGFVIKGSKPQADIIAGNRVLGDLWIDFI